MCGKGVDDKIYCSLRVVQGSDDKDAMRTHIVYKGVSANSWFTPIGITRTERPGSAMERPSPLLEPCAKAIRERAKSASAVLGRRHFELSRQELKSDEGLVGTSMLPKQNRWNFAYDDEDDIDDFVIPKSATRVTFAPQQCMTDSFTDMTWQPQSSVKPNPMGLRRSVTLPLKSGKSDLPELNVKQLLADYNIEENSEDELCDVSREITVNELKQRNRILNNGSISFRNVQAMKEAFDLRVKSAPPGVDRLHPPNNRTPSRAYSALPSQSRDPRPNHPGRWIQTPRPRSSLKPLMPGDHDSEAPSDCTGGFRACLASEDYINKMEKQQQAPSSATKSQVFGQQRARFRVMKKDIPTQASLRKPRSTSATASNPDVFREKMKPKFITFTRE